MKYIFGPVPSRRLGLSLGVDLVPPKTCNLDCVYCECGPTTDLIDQRRQYIPAEPILAELDQVLAEQGDRLDFVTLSGAGEPCLNSDLGRVLAGIKARCQARLAVITNSSLLHRDEVLDELAPADVLMPSLDAVSDRVLRRINRPHKSISPELLRQGLLKARARLKAEMWLEMLFIPGYNDTPEEVEGLKAAAEEIGPDKIQINTLVRPPALAGVRPLTRERLAELAAVFGEKAAVIAEPPRYFRPASEDEAARVMLDMIDRRPCTLEDLAVSLGRPEKEVEPLLRDFIAQGRVGRQAVEGRIYFRGLTEKNDE